MYPTDHLTAIRPFCSGATERLGKGLRRVMRLAWGFAGIVAALAVLSGSAKAATLTVGSAPYITIQSAIDAAVDGDIVDIPAGTFTGAGNWDLDTEGKEITVQGAGASQTIIDCSDSGNPHSGFVIDSGEDSDTVISSLTIANAIALHVGGGMYIEGSTPTIDKCTFLNNSVTDPTGSGGAIVVHFGVPVIAQCTFLYNTAGYGGAVSVVSGGAIIVDCVFAGNSAADGSDVDIANSHGSSFAYIDNCSSSLSNATDSGGGAIDFYHGAVGVISNSVIYGMTAGVPISTEDAPNSNTQIQYCDIAGGATGAATATGNIDADPGYADPVFDLSVPSTSPLVDAGTIVNTTPYVDIDGVARDLHIDIGAYEYHDPSAAAASFAISVPGAAITGQPFYVDVVALDTSGHTASGYSGTFDLTSTGGDAGLPTGNTLTSGFATLTVTLTNQGTPSIVATDGVTGVTGTSSPINVSGMPTHFLITPDVTSIVAGGTVNLTVTALQADGSTAIGYTGPAQVTGDNGTTPNDFYGLWNAGVATIPESLFVAGTTNLVVADQNDPTNITGLVTPITVSAGPTGAFKITAPTNATAGVSFPITVFATDVYGNSTPGYTGSVDITSSGGETGLPTGVAISGGQGTANVPLTVAGTSYLTATEAATSFTGYSNNIDVAAAAATHFGFSLATATAGIETYEAVSAYDSFDNVVTSYSGPATVTSDDPAAVLPTSLTWSSGSAIFPVTFKAVPTAQLTVTDQGTPSITGTTAVTVLPGVATFQVDAASPQVAGTPFTVTVTALDSGSSPVLAYSGPIIVTCSDGELIQPASISWVNGVATFDVTLTASGSPTITATDMTDATITGTSGTILVTAGPATHFSVTVPPMPRLTGALFNVTVTALDANGNVDLTYNNTVDLTSSDGETIPQATSPFTDGVAVIPAYLANPGSPTITVSDDATPSITGTSGPVTLQAVPVISGISPATGPAGGGDFTITVNGTDFLPDSVVTWKSVPLVTTYVSPTQLTATVPAAKTANPGLATVRVQLAIGVPSASGINYTITHPLPTLSSLSPTSKAANSGLFTLTVSGTGFVSGSTVMWGAIPLATTYVSATQLTATVPGGRVTPPGTVTVTVVQPDATASTNSQPFTITQPTPVVTNTVPSTKPAGNATFSLIVNGSGFNSGSVVYWNGSALATTYVAATQLTATVPAANVASSGTATVTVVQSDATASTTSAIFTIGEVIPVVSSLSPTNKPAGSGPFTLTVNGSAFLNGATVYFGALPLTTTYVSSTQLTASVPGADIASVGAVYVTVTQPGGTVSKTSVLFTIKNGTITVDAISPTTLPAGGGDFTITVTGTWFLNGATVQWKATPLVTTFVNSTTLTATIPAALIANPGPATVTARQSDGSLCSTSATFTITAPVPPSPSISTVSPSTAPALNGPTSITVTGSGFVSTSIVYFNGFAIPTAYVSATQLNATVPGGRLGTPGTVQVTVVQTDGKTSAGSDFAITQPVPPLTGLVPSSKAHGNATFALTVNGSSFVTGATVLWNGAPLTTTYVAATQLKATVPASLVASAGTATVTVQQPDGTVSTAPLTFTIN